MTQAEIDFNVIRRQNNKESQQILEENAPKLSYQCRVILNYLKTGKRLTVCDAAIGIYDEGQLVRIGDLRARIRDIREHTEVKDEKLPGGFKEYFL